MSYLFDLPDELLIIILLELPCKKIIELSNAFKKIHNLCDKYNLIEKRKYKGFPRKTGHSMAWNVTNWFVRIHNMEGENFKFRIYQLKENFGRHLEIILDEMNNRNHDLVRGDLICTKGINDCDNSEVYIFDGCSIISLDYTFDDYGHLPLEFKIINNNVPINYWLKHNQTYGMNHNNRYVIMWFDHKDVKQQLLDNIDFVWTSKYIRKDICTSFITNDIKYMIIYEYFGMSVGNMLRKDKPDTEGLIEDFKQIILNEDILRLELDDNYYHQIDNVLYLNCEKIFTNPNCEPKNI